MQVDVKNLNQMLDSLRDNNLVMELTLTNTQADLVRERHKRSSMKSYYRKSNDGGKYQTKIANLKEELVFWQDRCCQYEDKLECFLAEQEVETFCDGRYTDTIREAYMELVSMNVGTRNVERILR